MNFLTPSLLITAALSMAIEFKPTNEWQLVPEGVAVPAGLDIRMDIDKGGRWAKLPTGGVRRKQFEGDDEEWEQNSLAVPEYTEDGNYLTADMLPDLEDKVFDHDDSVEILHMYGRQLYSMYSDASNDASDAAGRVLAVSLRNNKDAVKMIAQQAPELVTSISLNERSLSILSALVSTKEGLNLVNKDSVLSRVQRELAYATDLRPSVAKAVTKLLKSLATTTDEDETMCGWVDALSESYSHNHQNELKQTAIDIVDHTGAFEELKVQCKPQPGLLPPHREHKRAVESGDRFMNPKARRNHFDEL